MFCAEAGMEDMAVKEIQARTRAKLPERGKDFKKTSDQRRSQKIRM
jgi:hypothetical protein